MAIHCAAPERGIDKKESLLVKLKAFRHLSGGPITVRDLLKHCMQTK